MIKKQIPNLFTLLNLLSGVLGIVMVLSDQLIFGAFFVFLGIFFDFFDGFFARLFKVEGNFGKELDSLADLVTSGLVPGFIIFQLLHLTIKEQYFNALSCEVGNWNSFDTGFNNIIPFIGFLIPLASAVRLAKFNIDDRQSDSFIGLPTPALALFVVSLPLITLYDDSLFVKNIILNKTFLILTVLIGSFLLNSELKLFALKFKTYNFSDNWLKYLFLFICVVLILLFNYLAIPLIIIIYLLISILNNIVFNK